MHIGNSSSNVIIYWNVSCFLFLNFCLHW